MNSPLVTWIVSRAKEPSTWAGVSAFVASLTFIPHVDSIATLVPAFGAFVSAALAVIMTEKKV